MFRGYRCHVRMGLAGVLSVLCLLVTGAAARSEDKGEPAYLIRKTKGKEPTAAELEEKSASGWTLAGVVKTGDQAGNCLCYFARNPSGKEKVKYEIVAEDKDYADAGPLNKERGNKGWQLMCVMNLGDDQKPGPYRYVYANRGGTHAHGILSAPKLVPPEKLDEQWGRLGFRLVGVVHSASDPGGFKYYIVLPGGKQVAQQHKAVSTREPPQETKELDALAKEGWALVNILPTGDKEQPYIFWLNRNNR